MSTTFRSAMVALVLLNVAFVHITGAVSMGWFLPLYGLTLASPFLVRFHDDPTYRVLWNVAVLAIFTVLVHDASSTGVRYLLEDGLILAAFCQVHLLNALRKQLKPDLLFFNSFLIALVTSFFSQDLVYSITFVIYAFVFIFGLQLSTVAATDRQIPASLLGAVIRDATQRAIAVLILTGVAFLFLPRDFQREGLVGDTLPWAAPTSRSGFTDEVRLGRSSHTTLSNRVVLEIHLIEGHAQSVPQHWRGATLKVFDKGGWRNERIYARLMRSSLDEPWSRHGEQLTRANGTADTRVRVRSALPRVERLFAPLEARSVAVAQPGDVERATPVLDGTLRYADRQLTDPDEQFQYTVSLGDRPPVDALDKRQRATLESYVELVWSAVPEEANDCLDRIAAGLPRNASRRVIVEECSEYLRNNYDYLLPGEQGAAKDLGDFFEGSRGGHCEYFATALAVLLRLQRIECRLVTGYLAHEWDEEARTLTVRDRDAHAWLEVWDEELGWLTVDPTPPRRQESGDATSWFTAITDTLAEWWRTIAAFDEETRDRALAWLATLPSRTLAAATAHPFQAAGIALVVAWLVRALWRRRRRLPAVVVELLRAARKAGLKLSSTETPRELCRRAIAQNAPPERVEALLAAARAHEAERFGHSRRT